MHRFHVKLPPMDNAQSIAVSLPDGFCVADNDRVGYWEALLNRAQIDYELKERLFDLLCMQKEPLAILRECASLPLPSGLLEALMEVF